MIWPFGNSEERKQKKRAKQARAFYEDALDQLEAQQYDKALDLLEQAKEFGHSEAEAKIAEVRAMFEKVEEQPAEQPQSTLKIPEEEANALYEKGIAARDRGDYSTALQALGDAAKGGMPAAIFEFGQLFFAGKGVERSLQRSFDCAMAAAKLGYPRAMLFIGTLYVKGLGFEPNGEKAVEWLGKAADLGDASAQFNLALLYSKGDLVERNFDKAIPLAKAAAAQGHEKAQQLLDNLQESERDEWMRQGVEAYKKGDFQNAAFLFRQSAGAGSAPAAFNLGLCYENGEGVRQDYTKALRWYTKAAELGHVRAQCSAGVLCENGGEGEFEPRPEEAFSWYLKSAEQGNARAQLLLASAYRRGFGCEQDPVAAVHWYTRAAEQDYAQAQYDLGLWYLERARDLNPEMQSEMLGRARNWLEKASAQGFEKAKKMLPDIIRLQGGGGDRFVEAVEAAKAGDHQKAMELYEQCAEEGIAEATAALGQYYEKGEGDVAADPKKALEYYAKAAEQGSPRGMLFLGMANETGMCTEKNMPKAIEYYRRAAEAGNARAMILLGVAYEEGKTLEKDMKTAMEWYQKAYDQGDDNGAMYLGMAYRDAKDEGLCDLDKADSLLRPLAENGNANAMREMALLEWKRTLGVREPEKVLVLMEDACEWAKKSKEAGDKRAEGLLKTLETRRDTVRGATPAGLLYTGLRLIEGKDIQQDEKTGLRMLEVAANAGSGPAASVLGLCYAKGDHVEADNDKARHWFERGAELKNPESMMNLAFMYLNGVGIEADPEKAAHLYEQAAEAGFAPAGFHLSQMYREGKGVPKDSAKEFEWALKAAEAGHVPAQYHVGALYWNGDGVGRNLVEAKAWMSKAAEAGFAQAKDMMARLEKFEHELMERQKAAQAAAQAQQAENADGEQK